MLSVLLLTAALANASQVIGLRVDPGYLYDDFSEITSSSEASEKIVTDAKNAGFNTLYVFAYSPTYGAFYRTKYKLTKTESGFGRKDFIKSLIEKAHAKNIKVVAGFPLNNFKSVWTWRPTWRSRQADGKSYRPNADTYLMSAWSNPYREWYRGLIRDFLKRHPEIDGIEGIEGYVDYDWADVADYAKSAQRGYFAAYPSGQLGGRSWQIHRAQGLTELHAILIEEAHAADKKAHVVQTWHANQLGKLRPPDEIRNHSGFDFSGILNLKGTRRPDFISAELIWQQWAAEFGTSLFSPKWTSSAATEFREFIGKKTTPILHIEISPFDGANGHIDVTDSEFLETIRLVRMEKIGFDIYDYHQLLSRDLLRALSFQVP